MLALSRKAGESVLIGGEVLHVLDVAEDRATFFFGGKRFDLELGRHTMLTDEVLLVLVMIGRQTASISIDAPARIHILRSELTKHKEAS